MIGLNVESQCLMQSLFTNHQPLSSKDILLQNHQIWVDLIFPVPLQEKIVEFSQEGNGQNA